VVSSIYLSGKWKLHIPTTQCQALCCPFSYHVPGSKRGRPLCCSILIQSIFLKIMFSLDSGISLCYIQWSVFKDLSNTSLARNYKIYFQLFNSYMPQISDNLFT